MTYVTPTPLRGIALKLLSFVAFVGMQSCIRLVGPEVATGQTGFFRAFFAVPLVLVYVASQGSLKSAFQTRSPGSHALRALTAAAGMMMTFYGVARLPLPESTAINFAAPLIGVALAALLLKERVRAYRWLAVTVGFAGVLVIMFPKLTLLQANGLAGEQMLGSLAMLGGAATSAASVIQVRRLVRTDGSMTIVLYSSLFSASLMLFTLPLGWSWLTWQDASALVLCGILGGIGQLLLTESFRCADVSMLAPFDYSAIFIALAVGYVMFGDVPTPTMLLGTAMVASAGIFILVRER